MIPALSSLNVSNGPARCLRDRSSSRYLSISPLHREFRMPVPHSRRPVSTAGRRWAPPFNSRLNLRSALPLNPINPDNARILRITAAAGTELADAYSKGTRSAPQVARVAPQQKRFKTRRAVIPHATWPIDQYSSLLPPVGVWAVSQSQCGGPSSQNPYPSRARWAVTPPTA